MIDDKKVKSAAQRYCDATYGITDDGPFITEAFRKGAKWAINEFLKELWHSANEKPNIKQGECCVTCLVKFKNGSTELCVYFRNPEGWVCDDMSPKDFKRNFKGWLYIDNLFPKKGDNIE